MDWVSKAGALNLLPESQSGRMGCKRCKKQEFKKRRWKPSRILLLVTQMEWKLLLGELIKFIFLVVFLKFLLSDGLQKVNSETTSIEGTSDGGTTVKQSFDEVRKRTANQSSTTRRDKGAF